MFKNLLFVMGAVASASCGATIGDIEGARTRAASGDSEAAMDLFGYFLSVKNDPTEAAFWLRVGAEQGSCAAMIEYGRMLGGARQDYAGRDIWLEKARQSKCDLGHKSEPQD